MAYLYLRITEPPAEFGVHHVMAFKTKKELDERRLQLTQQGITHEQITRPFAEKIAREIPAGDELKYTVLRRNKHKQFGALIYRGREL